MLFNFVLPFLGIFEDFWSIVAVVVAVIVIIVVVVVVAVVVVVIVAVVVVVAAVVAIKAGRWEKQKLAFRWKNTKSSASSKLRPCDAHVVIFNKITSKDSGAQAQ